MEERTYQKWMGQAFDQRLRLACQASELWIGLDNGPPGIDVALREYHRSIIWMLDEYIALHPDFSCSLIPLAHDPKAPYLVRQMLRAACMTKTGPMASVAGMVSEAMVKEALRLGASGVVVENGGDIFCQANKTIDVSIYAGASMLSNQIAIRIEIEEMPMAICTSSATVGHALSLGRADAVVVTGKDGALIDAFATAICNQTRNVSQTQKLLEINHQRPEINGLVAIIDDQLVAIGQIELISIQKGAQHE